MASYALLVPYAQASVSGKVFDRSNHIDRYGFANIGGRVALNLIGCPALTPAEFMKRKPTTTFGVSLVFVAPTGTYDPTRIINIGSKRWSFRPEIGIEQPIRNWFIDAAMGVWVFTKNTNFFGGHTFSQNLLTDFQAHVGYNFASGLWLAADANYYSGGATFIHGSPNNISLANSRYGLTLSVPVNKGLSAKLAWSDWLSGTFGNRYHTAALTMQYRWFD